MNPGARARKPAPKSFAKHPGINVALGHAGGTGVFPFETCGRENFDQIVKFDFLAQTHSSRAVLAHWRKSGCAGHLVFTSSYVAQIPTEGISAYVSAKAALEMFAKNLARADANGVICRHVTPRHRQVGHWESRAGSPGENPAGRADRG